MRETEQDVLVRHANCRGWDGIDYATMIQSMFDRLCLPGSSSFTMQLDAMEPHSMIVVRLWGSQISATRCS